MGSLFTPEGAAALRGILSTEGFAVVGDVLTQREANSMAEAFADDLRGIINLPGDDDGKKKAALPEYQDPLREWSLPLSDISEGFVSLFGLPHGKCGWGVRAHPNVKHVFSTLFETEEVCCGHDSIFFSPKPSEQEIDDERRNSLWPHADQSAHLLPHGELPCYQSIVYLWDCDKDGAATVVWRGSHKSVWPSLMAQEKFNEHFCCLNDADAMEFARHAQRVPVPAGGMIVWDSKTIHQGWNHGRRLAVPVCFEPKERRPKEVLRKKVAYCMEGVPTTHWASIGQRSVFVDEVGDGGTKELPLTHTAHQHLLVNIDREKDADVVDGVLAEKGLDPKVFELL